MTADYSLEISSQINEQPSRNTRVVVAGAGTAAQQLVSQLSRGGFLGSITILEASDSCPPEVLDLAALPNVSVRIGQDVTSINAAERTVVTRAGAEIGYDHLVIATGSRPVRLPVVGESKCLHYGTIDDAARLSEELLEASRVLGRRPLGILLGSGAAAGQAEAVLRSRGVRPIRTTALPAQILSSLAGSPLPVTGVQFEDGSSMHADLVVIAEDRLPQDELAATAGVATAPSGGIVVGADGSTSVPGIWAIGDAAAVDGVRLGLMVSASVSASACTGALLGLAA
ncbi:FAD-dependent oxidoreductase [Pseudarthrobacter sp. J1738]